MLKDSVDRDATGRIHTQTLLDQVNCGLRHLPLLKWVKLRSHMTNQPGLKLSRYCLLNVLLPSQQEVQDNPK